MDLYHFYIFLFTELGEINSISVSNVIQIGTRLVLWYYGWASAAQSAQGGGNEAVALYGTRGRRV
jgi:hypothetical protein